MPPLGPAAFLLSYFIPLVTIWGYLQGGAFNYTAPFFGFFVLPLMDLCFGSYQFNGDAVEPKNKLKNNLYKGVLWAQLPMQMGLVIWGAWIVSHGGMTLFELIGFTGSVGLSTGGIGISLAHEWIHKPTRHERLMGLMLLMNVCYMHFYIEHLLGHHRQVGTPEDAASARRGESLYRFYWRSLSGSYSNAWRLENKRLKRKKKRFWSLSNRMLWFTCWPLLYGLCLLCMWNWQSAMFFAAQSMVAFSLLEAINYIEHYGLSRQRTPKGYYEKVSVSHSWNANQIWGNCCLFMLQRHSDHHAHQSRAFYNLRHYKESPQLPTGYAGMLVLSICPPLWYWVMHKRLDIYQTGTKTN